MQKVLILFFSLGNTYFSFTLKFFGKIVVFAMTSLFVKLDGDT